MATGQKGQCDLNINNWGFAQQYSAKAPLIASLFFLIASIARCFFSVNNGTATIIEIVLLVITPIIIVLKTENKLNIFRNPSPIKV
ncbi:MAG: hypothetical protein ABIT05_02210 [Chitinophagaceae bacterium]